MSFRLRKRPRDLDARLYVVIALNGIEQAIKGALTPLASARAYYCGARTWVLRHEEVSKLMEEEAK